MPKSVAFLRAINVGGHTVKMDALRRLFEAMRFKNVETFIASGNVVFDGAAAKVEQKIERALEKALGYPVATFVRTMPEVVRIAEYKPFDDEEHTVYIGLLADAPSKERQEKLMSFSSPTDTLHVAGRELYWLSRTKFGDSKIGGALLEKTLGMKTTLRNTNTIQRIAAKYRGE